MDFTLPEELEDLRSVMRGFVVRELVPLERHIAREWEWEIPPDVQRGLDAKARELGLASLSVPTGISLITTNGSVLCIIAFCPLMALDPPVMFKPGTRLASRSANEL